MSHITIDGPAKVITIIYQGPVTTISAAEIYSEWKEWVSTGDNAKYLPAFTESVGGNDLGGGVSLAGYFFIRNDLGWSLDHQNYDQQILISGDLYPVNPAAPFMDVIGDNYDVTWILQRSAASYVSTVSGVTPADIWAYDVSGAATPGSAGQKLRDALSKLFYLSD